MATGGLENHDVYFDWRCNKCEDGDVITEATTYCKSCNECFCDTCLKDHNRFLKGHIVLGQAEKDDWGKSKQVTPQDAGVECSEHSGQNITMYCANHDDVCCSVCAFMHHGEACRPKMAYIPSVAKGIGNSAEFQTFMATNDSLLEHLDRIEKKRTEYISALRASREACQKDADIALQKFTKRLEGLKQKADLDINNKHDAEERSVQSDIDKCFTAKRELNEIKTNVPTIQPMNESSLFVQMKISQQKHREYANVCEVLNDQDLKTYSFEAEHKLYQMSLPKTLGKCVKKSSKAKTDQRPNESIQCQIQQSTARSQVTRQANRNRQDYFDIDKPMNQPTLLPRGTQRCMGDKPNTRLLASGERTLIPDTYRTIDGPNDGVPRRPLRGNTVTQDRKLTEILNDKPDDPRSLDFKHGPVVVSIYTGNIILSETDAIVNAANEFLSHAGGIACAIASAASPRLKDECEKHIGENGYLSTADVMHTCAGGRLNAKVKHIMHAVGPFWASELDPESRSRSAHLLTRTFLNILTYANKHLKIQSVTVPLISSGEEKIESPVKTSKEDGDGSGSITDSSDEEQSFFDVLRPFTVPSTGEEKIESPVKTSKEDGDGSGSITDSSDEEQSFFDVLRPFTVPSTGVFGGPMEGCVRAFLNAILIFVKDHCDGPVTLREVHLINNNSDSTVMTVMQIRECLGQQLDQLAEEAASEFEKMSMEDVVRRPRASGRSSDFSSSVRMERYQSMPSSMTGTDFSRYVTSPRDASGPTSLGYTSTRSRLSRDDDDDIVVGSRINPNTSTTSVGQRSTLLTSLSSDHTSSGGRSERSLQATTASTRSHMTSSSQSGARVTKANTERHMTQSHLTSSSQSRATASTGSHMNQSHLTSSSQSGATATTRSTGTPHTQGRPLPSTPKSSHTKF